MKKIAVNTVKNFLKENKRENTFTQTFEVGDNTFDVTFRTALSVMEKSVFLNRVVSGCFDMTGKYRPEYVSPMSHYYSDVYEYSGYDLEKRV